MLNDEYKRILVAKIITQITIILAVHIRQVLYRGHAAYIFSFFALMLAIVLISLWEYREDEGDEERRLLITIAQISFGAINVGYVLWTYGYTFPALQIAIERGWETVIIIYVIISTHLLLIKNRIRGIARDWIKDIDRKYVEILVLETGQKGMKNKEEIGNAIKGYREPANRVKRAMLVLITIALVIIYIMINAIEI